MQESTDYRPLPDWKEETTLVPFSGVQFLDFGFDLDSFKLKSMEFIERTTGNSEDAAEEERTLFPLKGDPEADAAILDAAPADDLSYDINTNNALKPFLEKWTPVPVLRVRASLGPGGREQYDDGPTCWARVLVTKLPERDPENGCTHRVILAIDTGCEPAEDPRFYLAPTQEDGERVFRFVSDPDDMSWFLCRIETDQSGNSADLQAWVDEWIYAQFLDSLRNKRTGKPVDESELEYAFEHWARYLAFVRLLDNAVSFPKIRLIDTVSHDPVTDQPRYTPVDVDLVLDIGNSRTCGILIEPSLDSSAFDLNDSYVLALRDLSNPIYRYKEPFESRVEFSDARFGQGRSPRARAFFWPSLVRVGPEAMRLTRDEEGTETSSGLSSPKRYLWDDAAMQQDWRFHNFTPREGEELPWALRAVQNEVNEAGDVIDQVQIEEKNRLRRRGDTSTAAMERPRFSRSSLYGLLLAELFLHALVQINDPAQRETRKQSDIPRRLRRIILTLPPATPLQEQAIMRSRAEGALRLLFKTLKWQPNFAINTSYPEIMVDWDEATCTQLVYLYTQITQKFGGQINTFFDLVGQPRKRPPGPVTEQTPAKPGPAEPSCRVACVDVGGGTTDLMITTFFAQGNRALMPRQDFREGFRIAGDDLLREIIARIILPQIARALEAAGFSFVDAFLAELFSNQVGDSDVRFGQKRRQFALRILTPLGLACLGEAENLEESDVISFRAADVLGTVEMEPATVNYMEEVEAEEPELALAVPGDLLDYLEGGVRDRGIADWSLADLEITVKRSEVDAVIHDVMQKPLSDLCEVVGYLGCDVLLLSGRPSRLPALRDLVRETMVVPPSRLVSMHEFEVGSWYPYRDPVTNRIKDPKSTAAVGAMLCSLADSKIVNFMVYTQDIMMSSTARFIGQIVDDAIPAEGILFSEQGGEEEATLELFAPTFLGFRQLPHARWTTTVLYRLDFANDQAARRPKPFKVTLERREFDTDPESAEEALRAEALKEGLLVAEVEDNLGDGAKREDVSLRLHTLGMENDYWLDTGAFRLG